MNPIRTLAAGLLSAALFATPASAQMVSIVTTPTGSFTNSIGAAIAKVVTEHTKHRATVQAQAQAAMAPVAAGNAEFGMSNSADVTFFATGTGYYEGQAKHDNLRAIGAITMLRVAFFVRADSPIKTIPELKGKRVSAGFNAQKTVAQTIKALLANGGLTYDDVDKVLAPNVSRSAEDFIAGKTDVLFFALGSAPVKQAAASVGGLRMLPIDDSPAALERMKKVLPGSYVTVVQPTPNLEGFTQPTKVFASDMVFFTNAALPDTIAYQVTKALHDNKAGLVATFKPMTLFDPKTMARPVEGAPFHPGAMKYYKEIGIAPKS